MRDRKIFSGLQFTRLSAMTRDKDRSRKRKSRTSHSRIVPSQLQAQFNHQLSRNRDHTEVDETIVLEREKFRAKVERLREVSHLLKDDLDSEHAALLKEVTKTMATVHGTSLYPVIIEDIREIFSALDKERIVPLTVHAHFVGCTSEDNFPGQPGCNPKCASGLPDPNTMICPDTFLSFGKNGFKFHNSKKTPHAWIYLEDSNFRGFSEEDIDELRKFGVSKASTLRSKSGHPHDYDSTVAVPIEKLPVRSGKHHDEPETTPSWIIWLILIFLFFLFFGAAIWYSMSR